MSNQTQDKMICARCDDEVEYDPSGHCLHCWTITHSLECECQNEECED